MAHGSRRFLSAAAGRSEAMIVLDTSVLSELMRSRPDAAVLDWLDRQASQAVWITSITLFDCRFGPALLPDGRRRNTLGAAFADLLSQDLEDRVLPFDVDAAAQAATLAAARHRGSPAGGHPRHEDRRHRPSAPGNAGDLQRSAFRRLERARREPLGLRREVCCWRWCCG